MGLLSKRTRAVTESSDSPPPQVWQQGAQAGRFRIRSRLAAGGMAELWLAEEETRDGGHREVVLKTMLPPAAASKELVAMFEAEAIIGLMLDHPNIVRVYDCGRLAQQPFIAMEYVDGLNLRQLKQRLVARGQGFPPRLLLDVITNACRGLHAAHELRDDRGRFNFVHRDVSPENLMVTRTGATKLIDFGAAISRYTPTRAPRFVGKVRYLPPERIAGSPGDARSDVYALGVILYEFLAGVPPFAGVDDTATVALIAEGRPRPLQELMPALPPQLVHVTSQAMALRPDDRHPTAAALATELLPLLEGGEVRPRASEVQALLRHAFHQTDGVAGVARFDAREHAAHEASVETSDAEAGDGDGKTVEMEVGMLKEALRQAREDATVIQHVGTRELMALLDAPAALAPAPAAAPAPVNLIAAAQTGEFLGPVPPASLFAPEPTGDSAAPALSAADLFRGLASRPSANWFDIRRPDPRPGADGFLATAGDARGAIEAAPGHDSEAARHFDRGLGLVERKSYAEAVGAWEQACALAPENRTYQVNLKRLRDRVRRQALCTGRVNEHEE